MKKLSLKNPAHLQISKLANLLIFTLANLLIFTACSKSDEPEVPASVKTPEHLTDWTPQPKVDVAQPYMAFATGSTSATTLSLTAVGSTATATDVWVDTNNNGIFDGDDVKVTDFSKPITFTAANGLFTVYGKVTELNASGNALTAADVRSNEALTKLNIADNWLEEKDLLDLVNSLPTATDPNTAVVLHRVEGDGNKMTEAVLIAAKQRGWQTLKIKDNVEVPDLPADTEAPKAGAITEATATAFNSVLVKWTAATDDKTAAEKLRYQVLYNVQGSGEVKTSELTENTLELTLTGLTEKTTYIVKVKVLDEAGNATEYEAKEVTTGAAPEAADTEAPKAGAISEATATFNSLSLKWTAATDNKTAAEKLRYQVVYQVKGSGEVKTSELTENRLELTLTGLPEKTTYVVKVKVLDEANNATEYEAKEVTTAAIPDTEAPTPATISERIAVTDQTATLSWETAKDNQTSFEGLRYQVFWKAQGSTEEKNSGTPKAAMFSYKIEGLAPSTSYTVWVEVSDKANNKAKYPEKTFTTAKKEEPKTEELNTSHYIVLTTDKVVGKEITIYIEAANEDQEGVWLDLNGNGKWDEGIDQKPTEFSESIKYTLQAQTFRIYGKVWSLSCGDNLLSAIDISHNPALTDLEAINNKLPSIAHLEQLKELSIDSHTLLASRLPKGLTYLDVNETTPLTTIDTSPFTELKTLNVYSSSLKSLDLSNNERLLTLYISKTGLTELDLSHQPQLTDLYADYTPLTKLNVAGNKALKYVELNLTQEGKGLQGNALMEFLKQLPTYEEGKEGKIYLSPAQATEGVKSYLGSKFWLVNPKD